jgi:hypothetical protein
MSVPGPGCVKTLTLNLRVEFSVSISSMRKPIALATSVGRRQLRKQFCASMARARFHTASVKSRPDGPEIQLPLYPSKRTQSEHRTMSVSCISGLMHRSKANPFRSLRPRASTDAGRSRPSALAVFRLTTSSYLVGVCAGRSAGFAPALISAVMDHEGAAPTSASSSSKARTKLPGGPRRGLGLSPVED